MKRRVIRPISARSEAEFIVLRESNGHATFVHMPNKIGAFVWAIALDIEFRIAKRRGNRGAF